MTPEEFIRKINQSLKTGQMDDGLLKHETRFLRGKYLLKIMENVSKILKSFDFKDSITFEESVPYIDQNGIKLRLNSTLYLKHLGKKYKSQSSNTINFIKMIKLNPKIIIDLGACWGEYSLFFAREFPNCSVFSIEGSPTNFKTFQDNLRTNQKLAKRIKPYNLIITDFDGIEEISNNLNGMNTIKSLNHAEKNFVKVNANKFNSFLNSQNLSDVDFIKIDIEGSELKLLDDLKAINFKLLQIELINYNKISDNLNFVKNLSEFCVFYNIENFKELSLLSLQDLIKTTLSKKPTIDIFCVNKNHMTFQD